MCQQGAHQPRCLFIANRLLHWGNRGMWHKRSPSHYALHIQRYIRIYTYIHTYTDREEEKKRKAYHIEDRGAEGGVWRERRNTYILCVCVRLCELGKKGEGRRNTSTKACKFKMRGERREGGGKVIDELKTYDVWRKYGGKGERAKHYENIVGN